MIRMRKLLSFMFCVLFIFSSFVTVFNVDSASALIEDSWNTKASMTQARYGLGVVAVDGKIYAIGGWAVDGFVGTTECYDPVSDTWVTLKSMPTPRHGFAIAAYQGKIYCIGGQTRDASGLRMELNVTEVYDVATDSWSTKASLPTGGTYLQADTVNGKIFVLVERKPDLNDNRQDLYMYDPAADSWTKKTVMSEYSVLSVFLVLAAVDDKLIVNGEFRIESSTDITYAYKIVIYDTNTDKWSEGTAGIRGIHYGAAGSTTGVFAPQRVYCLGLTKTGDDITSLTNRAYDPESDTWSNAKAMPTPRKGFGVAVVDDILYVIGGYTSDDFSLLAKNVSPIALNEQYMPIGHRNSDGTSSNPLAPSSYLTAAILVIIIGAVVVALLLHFKKR